MTDFVRESRYLVFKNKDVAERLTAVEARELARLHKKLGDRLKWRGKQYDAVVVEDSWPEYETVWRMIEERVTQQTHHLEVCKTEQLRQLAEAESMVVSVFFGDEIPDFRQGMPTHELQEAVTAEYCRGLVSRTRALHEQVKAQTTLLERAYACINDAVPPGAERTLLVRHIREALEDGRHEDLERPHTKTGIYAVPNLGMPIVVVEPRTPPDEGHRKALDEQRAWSQGAQPETGDNGHTRCAGMPAETEEMYAAAEALSNFLAPMLDAENVPDSVKKTINDWYDTGMPTPPRKVPPGGLSYEASMLRNLLARIHRDGGQYIAEHGLDKAIEDAETIIAALHAGQAPRPE